MKTITEQHCIAVLPASPGEVTAGLLRFEDVISTRFWQRGECKRMIDEGWIHVRVINIANVPTYLLGFHFTDDRGMWIDILQSLEGGVPDGVAANQAIEAIAREARCQYVRLYTARRGLIEFQKAFGYQAEAVLMTKEIK